VAPGGPAERHLILYSSLFMGASPQTPGLAALEAVLEIRAAFTAVLTENQRSINRLNGCWGYLLRLELVGAGLPVNVASSNGLHLKSFLYPPHVTLLL
jgi:hypothetical protein